MAFDKNNMPVGMQVVVVIFAVILILSLCLPFFSSCNRPEVPGEAATEQEAEEQVVEQAEPSTVADIDAAFQPQLASLRAKLESDPGNLAALGNLGNVCMDWGTSLQQASDAGTEEAASHIEDVFMTAVSYYDQYLDQDPESRAVRVDRACCEYYAGDEEGGIADLEAFVAEDGSFSPAWFNLGLFKYQQGDLDAALEAFNKSVEADAAESFGVAMMGQVYAQLVQSQIESAAAEEQATAEGEQAAEDAPADETGDVEAQEAPFDGSGDAGAQEAPAADAASPESAGQDVDEQAAETDGQAAETDEQAEGQDAA